jgi:hypothetical protein
MYKSLREPLLSCEILEGVNFCVWISIHSPSLWDTVPGRQEGCLSDHHQGHCPVLDSERWCAIFGNTRLVAVHETFDKGTNAEYAGLPRMSRYVKNALLRIESAGPQPTGRGGRLRETCEELDQGDWGAVAYGMGRCTRGDDMEMVVQNLFF